MNTRTIAEYALIALAVIILGALAGWYFFLRSETGATAALNAARGFDIPATSGAPFGVTGNSGGFSTGIGPAFPSRGAQKPAQLWQVATTPDAGIGFATSTQGVRVRFVDRQTGYVFDADPATGEIVRLTDTLMPKTYEALIAGNKYVYERSLDSSGAITTFAGTVPVAGTSSSQTLSGNALPKGILELADEPSSGQIFYLAVVGGGVQGIRSMPDGSAVKQIFSSALRGWDIEPLADGRIVLAQKAADSLMGYAYTLQGDGTLRSLISGPGLSVLLHSGSGTLLYGTASGGLALFSKSSASSTPVQLPVHTIADKCVWAPDATSVAYCAVPQTPPSGDFLDAWYRGSVHTSDAFWRIDAATGEAQLIYSPGNVSIDVESPVIDSSGSYIAFLNGADGTPWVLRLNK